MERAGELGHWPESLPPPSSSSLLLPSFLHIAIAIIYVWILTRWQDQYEVIDLSDNEITKVENFPFLPRLTTLLINTNKIAKVGSGLGSALPNLQCLSLTNNRIQVRPTQQCNTLYIYITWHCRIFRTWLLWWSCRTYRICRWWEVQWSSDPTIAPS